MSLMTWELPLISSNPRAHNEILIVTVDLNSGFGRFDLTYDGTTALTDLTSHARRLVRVVLGSDTLTSLTL